MSIATEKLKQSSDRFVLVRMEPARHISNDLVLDTGSIYQATLEDIDYVSKIQRNGANLTEVTTIAGNDQYTFDEDTHLLRMQLASAPNEDSNVIVLFHYLYLTTGKGRYYPSNPLAVESASNLMRFWEPRVQRSPAIEESYKNIINAVFTIKASSISVTNEDSYLNPYLGLQDSFKNKTVDIYVGINDALDQLFSGPMNDISIRDTTAQISFRDAFSKVNDLATFSGEVEDAQYTGAQYSLLDPESVDKPKIMNLGAGTPARNFDTSLVTDTPFIFTADKKYADVKSYNQATNISYNSTSASGNREWHLCRTRVPLDIQAVSGLVRFLAGTVGNTYDVRGTTVHYYNFTSHNLKVGQTFKWDDGGGPYYAIVHHVGDFDPGDGLIYNIMVANNSLLTLSDPIMTAVSQFRPLDTLAVVRNLNTTGIASPNFSSVYLKQETQYTVDTLGFANGITEYGITLDASISFDPLAGHTVIWQGEFSKRTILGQNQNHAGLVYNILLEILDIPVNVSTFTAARDALDLDARFQVPKFGETSIPSYRSILEDILGSALTYLSQNSSGEAEYGILSATTPGDTRDRNLILDGSQSVSYDYNDIYQTIRYKNRHQTFSNNQTGTVDTTDNKSIYLHGEARVFDFEHVLDDISTRIDAHLQLTSSRQAEYSYDVATEDIDTELGEDVTLESDKITSSGSQNVKITSIKRSADRIQVRATDLGELT